MKQKINNNNNLIIITHMDKPIKYLKKIPSTNGNIETPEICQFYIKTLNKKLYYGSINVEQSGHGKLYFWSTTTHQQYHVIYMINVVHILYVECVIKCCSCSIFSYF